MNPSQWRWLPKRLRRRFMWRAIERGKRDGTLWVETWGTNMVGYEPAGEGPHTRCRWSTQTNGWVVESDDAAS